MCRNAQGARFLRSWKCSTTNAGAKIGPITFKPQKEQACPGDQTILRDKYRTYVAEQEVQKLQKLGLQVPHEFSAMNFLKSFANALPNPNLEQPLWSVGVMHLELPRQWLGHPSHHPSHHPSDSHQLAMQ